MLKLVDISKSYKTGEISTAALNKISISFRESNLVASAALADVNTQETAIRITTSNKDNIFLADFIIIVPPLFDFVFFL